MPTIHNADDLGRTIRSRRRVLGWDQATLAQHVGVTRQWVIDIEKGKPRAEVDLALRALRVLGLHLFADPAPESATSSASTWHLEPDTASSVSLDNIIERHRYSLRESDFILSDTHARGRIAPSELQLEDPDSHVRLDRTAIERLQAIAATMHIKTPQPKSTSGTERPPKLRTRASKQAAKQTVARKAPDKPRATRK